jgi:hypothetical protein
MLWFCQTELDFTDFSILNSEEMNLAAGPGNRYGKYVFTSKGQQKFFLNGNY